MEHILKNLEQNIILNDQMVIDIKQNIRHNHPTADSKYRARLLAQSLHEKLDEQLKGLDSKMRSEVRISIFKTSIESSRLNISQKDLLQEILLTESRSDKAFDYLVNWFNEHTDETLAFDELKEVMYSMNPDLENAEDLISMNVHLPPSIKDKIIHHYTKYTKKLKNILNSNYYKLAIILLSFILTLPIFLVTQFLLKNEVYNGSLSFVHANTILLHKTTPQVYLEDIVEEIYYSDRPGYPDFLKYQEVNIKSVTDYLHTRNSSFTDEGYLNVINNVAMDYDVHPLLLLAIIGQEQGFVPKDSPHANRIMNNPFNVYTSWKKYNTSLSDSCEVAAGTIQVILSTRPKGENPFQWLNTRYAEDQNWWKGVQELFYTLLAHSE